MATTADHGRHERERERVRALEEAPVQAEAADDDREHVGEVGQDEEGHRLVGDGPLRPARRAAAPTP